MRKVTASAVILTAITGCSQSEVPSAEWSFEAPPNGITGEVATRGATGFTTTEQESSLGDQLLSSLSPEAQRFLDQTASNKAGPAFEQPLNANGISSADSPILRQGTASRAFPSSDGTSPQPASDTAQADTGRRTDTLSSVRAYLGNSRNSSSLGDRVPYSAQVSLPASPVYKQPTSSFAGANSTPLATAADGTETVNLETESTQATNSASSASNPSALLSLPNDAAAAIATLNQPDTRFSTSDLLTATAPTEPVAFETSTSATLQQNVVSRPYTGVATSQIEASGLPTLQPATPQAATAQTALPRNDENVSIGTVILRDLQQQRNESEEGPIGAERTDAAANSIEIADVEAGGIEAGGVEADSIEIEANSADSAEQDTAGMIAIEVTPVELETASASTPATGAEEGLETESLLAPPTAPIETFSVDAVASAPSSKLARLIETIPQATESPLIAEFRAAEGISHHISLEPSASEALENSLEHFSADSAPTATGVEASLQPSSESRSPLLEGLSSEGFHSAGLHSAELNDEDATGQLQTLYMPIPETSSTEASAALIRAAIALLGNEAHTANLVNELQTTNVSVAFPALETAPEPVSESTPGSTPEEREASLTSGQLVRFNAQPDESLSKTTMPYSSQMKSTLRLEQSPTRHSRYSKAVRSRLDRAPRTIRLNDHAVKYRQRILWP